jgi:hypothetical protein
LAQNQFNLLPIQNEAQLEQQKQAAQATGWNNAAQSEFQGLIEKMNAGVTLSQAEIERANQLAQIQEAYQAALAGIAATLGEAQLNNQYQNVKSGDSLFNTFANTAINPSIATSKSSQGVAKYG